MWGAQRWAARQPLKGSEKPGGNRSLAGASPILHSSVKMNGKGMKSLSEKSSCGAWNRQTKPGTQAA